MRQLAAAALVFAIGIAACGGTTEVEPESWNGPERPFPADGRLPVEDFRAYAESVDEHWEHDPAAVAREFTQLPAAEVTVLDTAATVLRDGLEDDSIRAERYNLELERDGDVWTVASATWEQRCQPMRGHQDFSPQLCV